MFGKLASLVWDPGTPKPNSTNTEPSKTPPGYASSPAAVASPGPVLSPAPAPSGVSLPKVLGQVDPDMLKILEEAIASSNLPGFDYIEFRDSLVRMQGVPMSEEQKFQAVFATAQSIGVTKQKLLEAVDHYLGVIKAKDDEFTTYSEEVYNSKVASVEASISQLTATIDGEAAEIKRLTESIQARRKQQDEMTLQVLQARQDIGNKKAAYQATRDAVVGNLTADRSKIEAYLK